MIEVTRNDLAKLRGCTPSTVSRAKLGKTSSGNYDLEDPETWGWVTEEVVKKALRDYKQASGTDLKDLSLEMLEKEKLKEDIIWKKSQTHRNELKTAQEKKELIHVSQVAAYLGGFANGLKVFIFPIGKRLFHDDKKGLLAFEKELSKAIEKIFQTAEKNLQHESKILKESIKGE